MKQTYQKPATVILHVEAQPMLQDSMPVNSSETINKSGDILSRRGNSVWDDEDDNY